MSTARRIARNRRRESALVAAGVSNFETSCRSDPDPGRSKERMRILDKVRAFALHVSEPDIDKAWAYLIESRKDYVAKRDGLSEMMSAVDDWWALNVDAFGELHVGGAAKVVTDAVGPSRYVALCETCKPPHTEECTKGHGVRPCEKCGVMFRGGCTPRSELEKA